MQQHPEAPQLNERISTVMYASRLRERRLKRLIDAYEQCGRPADAQRKREALVRTQEDRAFSEPYFYKDLGSD